MNSTKGSDYNSFAAKKGVTSGKFSIESESSYEVLIENIKHSSNFRNFNPVELYLNPFASANTFHSSNNQIRKPQPKQQPFNPKDTPMMLESTERTNRTILSTKRHKDDNDKNIFLEEAEYTEETVQEEESYQTFRKSSRKNSSKIIGKVGCSYSFGKSQLSNTLSSSKNSFLTTFGGGKKGSVYSFGQVNSVQSGVVNRGRSEQFSSGESEYVGEEFESGEEDNQMRMKVLLLRRIMEENKLLEYSIVS
jgi:hypothetical protein